MIFSEKHPHMVKMHSAIHDFISNVHGSPATNKSPMIKGTPGPNMKENFSERKEGEGDED